MGLTKLQKDYIKTVIYQNKGSQSTTMKDDIIKFAKALGLNIKNNFTKEAALNLIFNTENEDKLYEEFAPDIAVPFYDVAKLNNITYKQVSDLDQLGILNALTYTGHKDSTLYPLSTLSFKEGELAEILNNKHKKDFFKIRIEINNIDDMPKIIDELSKMFEIENLSKPYPNKDNKDGCYIYLFIRSLDGCITNLTFKNQENEKLKLENSDLKAQIQKLNFKISNIEAKEPSNNPINFEALRKKIAELEESSDKVKFFEKKATELKQMNDTYKNKITELEEKLKNSSPGGRPPKFTDQEKETIKMYRLQGKSIRKIAEIFNCSAGLVHKIINEY